MEKKINHIQCKLKKNKTYQISWLPEKYVKIGNFLKLKDDNGWEVIKIWSKMNSKKVQERSIDYRNQRKMSDI